MESNWRWFREWYGQGGYNLDLLEGDRSIRFLAKLNPPVVVPGLGTMTHIAVGPRYLSHQRYYLGVLAPVGGGEQFVWFQSNVKGPGLHFPFPEFPVEPDS